MSLATPTTLLLDFGSVISFSAFERHRQSEQLLGLPTGSLTWLGPIDPATDPLWQTMQQDEITEREYWEQRAREVGTMLGRSWAPKDFFTAIRGTDPNRAIRPSALATIRRVRAAGKPVGILSNELELFWGRPFMDRLELLKEIDVLVDGTHTHYLKPDSRAYRLALDLLNVDASAVVFVDDQPRNIAGAAAMGLNTVFFDLQQPDACFDSVCRKMGVA
jgi:putative hydrolase of the HAD superfamily